MSIISEHSNKYASYKSHIVPSVVTAALALSAAIPLTAALTSNASPASADVAPVLMATRTAADTCGVSGATNASTAHTTGAVMGASTVSHYYYTTVTTPGATSNGNSNTNGNGSQVDGNTQTNVGGLVGGVNANVSASLLNDVLNHSLNNVASGNNVSVPVLNNVDVAPVVAPVVTSVVGVLSSIKL